MTPRLLRSLLLLVCLSLPILRAQDSRPSPEPTAQLAIEKVLRERLARPITGPLDVDLITLGEDLCGASPRDVRFSLDERFLIFDWKRWNEKERGTFVYDIERKEYLS